MKKINSLALTIALALAPLSLGRADTGYDAATRTEKGDYISVQSVSLSSTAGTTVWAASSSRPDGVLFNNSAYTIWIGTDTGNYFGPQHPNITNGFPVLSSGTFKLDGQVRGTITATLGSQPVGAAVTGNIRILNGNANVAPVIIP